MCRFYYALVYYRDSVICTKTDTSIIVVNYEDLRGDGHIIHLHVRLTHFIYTNNPVIFDITLLSTTAIRICTNHSHHFDHSSSNYLTCIN